MKIITFEVPEEKATGTRPFTRILGKLWVDYLISQGEIDIAPEKRDTDEYKLTDDEVILYGQLLGEIAKSEGRDG